MSTAPTKLTYRPSIDGLRAIAVLLVVGYHAFPSALPGGFVGVDMFFVISGFLISSILYGDFAAPNRMGLRVMMDFYERRVRRIFPALGLVLLACYLAGLVFLLPQEFGRLCLDSAEAAGFCLNLSLAGRTGYFEPASTTIPLLHLWSLGVEEQFYLFWPLVIWVGFRLRARMLPVAVFVGGCSLFWNVYKLTSPPEAAFFLPQTRLWELLIGAALAALLNDARMPVDRVWRSVRESCALVGAALVIVGVVKIGRQLGAPNGLMLLPTLGTALLIGSGENTLICRRILARKPAVWIGIISYPLYLWHWPLLVFSRMTSDDGDSRGHLLGAIVAALLLAWATYRWVESPVRHASKKLLTVALPFVSVALLGLVGYLSYREGGFPGRVPPILRDPSIAVVGHEIPWRVGSYFLSTAQTGDNFKVDKNELSPGKPTLVLWGDSHAASLYPGYAKYFSQRYNIMQRTVQGTAPILGLGFPNQPNSQPINNYIFEAIRRVHPDSVVLSANWLTYDWRKLRLTILALKSVGIAHIIVIGPLPQWKGLGLPQQLYNYYRTHLYDRLPERMKYGIRQEAIVVDSEMRQYFSTFDVNYISPCDILSNKDGFITRVGDTPESIMTFDYGHLTKAGSEYLVARFPGACR